MRPMGWLASAVMLLVLASLACQGSMQMARGGVSTSPVVSPASAPRGTEALAGQWVKITVPDLGVMLAAIARPFGAGPFPAVILLHGSHGFAQEYVRLAQDLARGGLLAVAACWFRGGGGAGARFITPISCPDAPFGDKKMQTVDALVQATRTLPGVRPDRIGLFGHSAGAIPTIEYIQEAGSVQAAVLNSGCYYGMFVDHVSRIKVPILMLHGTADSPEDGGGGCTNVQMARDFERAMRAAGKSVEAIYYEGGRHNSLFSSATQHSDEVQRIIVFFRQYLYK